MLDSTTSGYLVFFCTNYCIVLYTCKKAMDIIFLQPWGVGGSLSRTAGVGGSPAAYRHLSTLLESLDRRQLLRLRDRAQRIMHPDFTAWLPDEVGPRRGAAAAEREGV